MKNLFYMNELEKDCLIPTNSQNYHFFLIRNFFLKN